MSQIFDIVERNRLERWKKEGEPSSLKKRDALGER
jgi:hypothetical protein